jgi:hypothetical protein
MLLQLLVIKALLATTTGTRSHGFVAVKSSEDRMGCSPVRPCHDCNRIVRTWETKTKRSSIIVSRATSHRSSTSVLLSSPLNEYDVAPIIHSLESLRLEANEYAEQFGLGLPEAAMFGLFASIRKSSYEHLGLRGKSFVLRGRAIEEALQQPTQWASFFTMNDLEKALEDDFLDAARGSTDNRKGWKVRPKIRIVNFFIL